MEGPVVTMQEIFRFVTTGRSEAGELSGYFEATGIVPRSVEKLKLTGVGVPAEIFERGRRMMVGPR
jgi:pilus assembly protein CpaF